MTSDRRLSVAAWPAPTLPSAPQRSACRNLRRLAYRPGSSSWESHGASPRLCPMCSPHSSTQLCDLNAARLDLTIKRTLRSLLATTLRLVSQVRLRLLLSRRGARRGISRQPDITFLRDQAGPLPWRRLFGRGGWRDGLRVADAAGPWGEYHQRRAVGRVHRLKLHDERAFSWRIPCGDCPR